MADCTTHMNLKRDCRYNYLLANPMAKNKPEPQNVTIQIE